MKFANTTAQDPYLETQLAFLNRCSPPQSTVWYAGWRKWNPLCAYNKKKSLTIVMSCFSSLSHKWLLCQCCFHASLLPLLFPQCADFVAPWEDFRHLILSSFVITLPKTWGRITDANSPRGAAMTGERSKTRGGGCFIPQQVAEGCRPVTDLHLIQTCDRCTDVWVQWQKDSLKWNQCRNKRLHCLITTVFWGCLCYLYLLPSASPLHHYYRHINAFFPHSLFIAAPGAFVFTGHFTIFILAQASSFLVYFYIEFLRKAVRDVASRQTGNVLLPSVMVLLLPTPICYIPQLTCFHCSAPNSLDMLLLQEKVLI